MWLGFYPYSKNNHIAGFLCLLQKLLATCSLHKLHLFAQNVRNPQRTAYDSPPAEIHKIFYVSSIQQNNWVGLCLKNSLMNNRGERIFGWNTLFFLQASSKLSSASFELNLKPNFLKIYLNNPYHFLVEILLRTSLFFWYVKILLKSFSFWDIKNAKPKFQSRYAYKLYAYKNECMKCEKR